MDKGRIRRAAEAASVRSLLGKRPGKDAADAALKRRLVVYLFAVLALGAWIFRSTPGDVGRTPAIRPIDEDLVPGSHETPLVHVDHELLASVRDATPSERARLEHDARLHLLDLGSRLIFGDLERLGLHKADRDELVADPSAHRGEAVWVIGRLKWWDSATLDGLYEVRGELEDEQGRSWAFLAATEPRDLSRTSPRSTPPSDIAIGEVVRLKGFFLKVVDLARPERSIFTAPMIVGRELLRSAFRIDPVTRIDDGLQDALDRVQDATLGLSELPLESPVFYELLSFSKNAEPETFVPPEQVADVTPAMLLKDPAGWRGRPVRIVGVLLEAEQIPLGPNGENPLGEQFVWRLWASDARAGELGTMTMYTFEIPPGLTKGTIIEATGRFYRRYAYETPSRLAHLSSVIVARDVWTFVPPEDTFTPFVTHSIVAGGGVVLLLIILGIQRDRRSSAKERVRRMGRTRKLVALPGILHAHAHAEADADADADAEAEADADADADASEQRSDRSWDDSGA